MDKVLKAVNLTLLIGKMMPQLNEKQRRQFLGSLSRSIGPDSVNLLAELSGVARDTIIKGEKEVSELPSDPTARPKASSLKQSRKKTASPKGSYSKRHYDLY